MSDIFLSYSRADKPFILQLKRLIEGEGYSVWLDQTEITGGDDWWQSIEEGIRTARIYLVVMTPDSEESRWVKREFLLAETIGKPIIPILHKGEGFSQTSNINYIEMPPETYTHIPANLKKVCTSIFRKNHHSQITTLWITVRVKQKIHQQYLKMMLIVPIVRLCEGLLLPVSL
ncbi:MAG: toll/interleukin-1 receptor domain-containing protein [Anaerolineae bacterium]|nr:toll/interleukin-1 receptor domain-containing protein [Anaerolineae bacterium]